LVKGILEETLRKLSRVKKQRREKTLSEEINSGKEDSILDNKQRIGMKVQVIAASTRIIPTLEVENSS
jgi:hypothetical protein